jgi:hypothetical protein
MKFSRLISKNYSKIFLAASFIVALILRWWYLPQKAISFAYDQARDAFTVAELLHGHIKILGPPVSGVPGLFHGVLYYYVIAPAYLLGRGNPVVVAYFMSLISSLGIFTVYFLTKTLTKNETPALIASLIFAFSFEASQYANLLTNASMGVWFVPIIYIGLYFWLTRTGVKQKDILSKYAPAVTGLAFGLSVQSEIALTYHIFPLVIWLLIFRKKVTKKDIVMFLVSIFIAVSSMLLSEVKFGFTGTSGILYILTRRDGIVKAKTFFDYVSTLASQSAKTFAYTLFPINVIAGGLVGFLMIISSVFLNFKEIKKKILTWETFLITYIFAYALALPFGGWNMKHILVGVAPAVAVFAGIFIWKYFGKYKILVGFIMVVILSTNLISILKENKNGQTLFPLQTDLTLEKEIGVVNYTYQKSGGKPFSISTLTSPLYINTLWSYMYNWYGQTKYGYLPSWVGKDQIGLLGDNLVFATSNVHEHFFIIEPTYGIPDLYVGYEKGEQDSLSTLVDSESFGELTVQERLMKK